MTNSAAAMSESKERLLDGRESFDYDDSTVEDHEELRRKVSNLSFTDSPSLRRYLTIAAYAWAAVCTIPALMFFVQFVSSNVSTPQALRWAYCLTNIQKAHDATMQPAETTIHDLSDGFSTFRRTDTCSFSTLDLHRPFTPLCDTRSSLLNAMSTGGRIGFDAPYSPRDCDMRWFRPDEMCEILSRFSRVQIIGDSLMRNLAVALNLLMRTDLYNGGRTTWVDDPEGADCHCSGPFEDRGCDVWHVTANTELVHEMDPGSLYCPYDDAAKVTCECCEYSGDALTDSRQILWRRHIHS